MDPLFQVSETTKAKASASGTIPVTPGQYLICTDTGDIYYDGTDKVRHHLAETSFAATGTLSKSGWSNESQTVSISGVKADSNGVVGVAQTISASALSAAEAAQLTVSGQTDGKVTITAGKTVPTVDIPIAVILFP